MHKLERKGEVLAPLLVQARQSAQLGSLEQRFLLQTRSLAFVDLIGSFFEPSMSHAHEVCKVILRPYRIHYGRPILSGYLTKINETRIVKLR